MKINLLITMALIVFSLSLCQSKTTEQNKINDSVSTSVEQSKSSTDLTFGKKDNFLIIIGKDIWVRNLPSTGTVVMKLNEGEKCKILEKGKLEMIKGRPDYWYKIEFNQTEGWVFGSQTDIMLFKPLDQPFTGSLTVACTDEFIQETGTPSSLSYSFNKGNTFRFSVAAGYSIEGKTEWKANLLILKLQNLIMDSPDGITKSELKGMITFTVYKKNQLICLAENENNMKDKTYSPSGGCFCLNE